MVVLLERTYPLYVLMLLGFIPSRFLGVRKEPVASVLIYFIAPAVIFGGLAANPFKPGLLSVPVLVWALSAATSYLILSVARRTGAGASSDALGYTAGAANTGYLGLPLAIAIYGKKAVPAALMAILGTNVYLNTNGSRLSVRGSSPLEGIKKLARSPSTYAFALGIAFSMLGIHPPSALASVFSMAEGTYSVLGTMLIGMTVTGLAARRFDVLFISTNLVARFLVSPSLMVGCIYADKHLLRLFDDIAQKVLFLVSILPVAASVAFMTEMKVLPEKAAPAVFVSTLVALFLIPLAVTLVP